MDFHCSDRRISLASSQDYKQYREKMKITVILCTFNRCQSLPKALDSVAAQVLPESVIWEVIVVDNNSSDQTRVVAEDYCRRYPGRFRYLCEPQQGLSRARNAGIRDARGEIIAFMDDDVTLEPTWLQDLTASLHDGEWVGAGGRILPPQDFQPPGWLTLGGEMDLGGPLALFDLGNVPGELKKAPYGTNMAFRKGMFEKYGTFRVDLGRCGNSLLSSEDTEFGRRLMSAGERLRYEPSAVVHHPVPKDRLRKKYFRAWWFDFGRARILERGARPSLLGIPRQFISIPNLVLRYLSVRTLQWLLALNPQRRFYNKCRVWMTVGEIAQTYRQSFEAKSVAQEIPSQS
jgi:glucosyl-dolichyl phosphate glucuronosyltransferase